MSQVTYSRRFWGVVIGAILCSAAGALLCKYVSIEAGAPIVGFGGWLLGLVKEQPEFARMRRRYTIDDDEPKTPTQKPPMPPPPTVP